MRTLYASDLDGTLLDATAHLSDTATAMIHELQQRGVLVTFVTARTPATIEPILHTAPPNIPGVAMTGASIWSPSQRRYLDVKYHKPDDAATIHQICLRNGVFPFIYTLQRGSNALVVYHEAPKYTELEQRFVDDRTLNDLKSFNQHTMLPDGDEDNIVLFFAMGDPDKIRRTAEDIRSHTDCYASWYPDTYNPGISLLEVFTAGVSKAEGLLQLKDMLGADRVVAFGDNLNDIPMLQAADIAVAVDNAHPEVKAVADIVIGSNTEDAVPRYILEQSKIGGNIGI